MSPTEIADRVYDDKVGVFLNSGIAPNEIDYIEPASFIAIACTDGEVIKINRKQVGGTYLHETYYKGHRFYSVSKEPLRICIK